MSRIPRILPLLSIAVIVLLCFPSRSGYTEDEPLNEWYRPPSGFNRVEYVILTGQDLVEAWEPLREWKCRTGLPADVVAVEDVLANPLYRGADGPETIRNFLKDLYWKWGLSWVLLGADVNIVPTRFIKLMEKQASDIYFACLEGTWNEDGDSQFGSAHDRVVQQADVYLGRVPVETPAEIHAFLTKYFKYVKPVNRDYQKRLLLVGAVLGSDYRWDADDHYEYMKKEYLEPGGFEITHLEQTDFLRGSFEKDAETGKCSGYLFGPPNGKTATCFRSKVIEEINKGYGLLSHYAHSNTYAMGLPRGGFRNADVKKLTNAERPCVFYSCGCHVNQFDHESISEEILLHPGGGAVAFIGCTVNSYALQNLYERDFFGALLRHGEYRIGRVHEASRARPSAGNSAGMSSITVLNRGLSLLGDPHMPLWTKTPADLTVSFNSPIAGQDALEVKVTGPSGSPVSGAEVALWKKGSYLARRKTGESGIASIPLPLKEIDEVELTVTARDFVPLERTVPITRRGGKLVPFDISLDGPDEGRLGTGRTVEITVAIRNDGEGPAKGVTARLTTKDPHVQTGEQLASYPDAEPGAVTLPEKGFTFSVKPEAPPHHLASFQLRILAGGDTAWEGPIRLPVHIPQVILSGHSLKRKGKEASPPLEPSDGGSTLPLDIRVANLGSGTARGITIQLECPHDDIEVGKATQTIESISPGEGKSAPEPFPLTIASGFSGGPVEFVLRITPENGGPREEVFTVRAPPPSPKGLKAQAGEASVYLIWAPVEATRLAGYRVFRAESKEGVYVPAHLSPVTSSCFEDRGLSAKSVYFYRVCALDRDLNPSSLTPPISISTTFPPLRDWPKKTKSPIMQVTVCDVDGDGDLEIATGDSKGGIWIWHHSGAELRHGGDNWTFGLFKELPEGAFAPTFADLDGDGKMEVLSAGRHGDRKVHALTLDGEPVPGWPKPVKGRLMTPPQVADLDGDGSVEIVFHEGFGKNMYVWRRDGSSLNTQKKKGKAVPKEIIGQTDPFTYLLSTLADLDGDGKKEIVGIGGRGNVYAFKADGTMLEGFPYKAGGPLGSTAPVGDLDGNGRPEIVFVAKGGTELYALEWNGIVRKHFPVKVSKMKPGEGQSIPALADLDGKKGLEIVLGGRDGSLFAVDGEGKNLPGFPVNLPKEACGSAVGDIDGDGAPEIVVGCADGNVYAFDPDGKPLRGFPLRTGGPVKGVPVITDIDGDGDVDILAASNDGYVHIWDLSAQHDPGKVAWSMYGGNFARTGVPFTPPEPPRSISIQGTTTSRIMWRPPKTKKRTRIEAYHVYRGQGGIMGRISSAPVKKLSFLDKDIVPGRLYTYTVTCVDSNGSESSPADPVSWGEEKVSALFSKGERFEKRKKYKEAIRTYEELLKTYPKSRFAEPARARLEKLRSDEGVLADLEQRKIDGWCRGMLGLARTWEKSGKTKKAAECYRKVMERYPNTAWAEKAKASLKALEGK